MKRTMDILNEEERSKPIKNTVVFISHFFMDIVKGGIGMLCLGLMVILFLIAHLAEEVRYIITKERRED